MYPVSSYQYDTSATLDEFAKKIASASGVSEGEPGGKTGMVHISEMAPTYVKEIRDYVTENQMVKVKVLSISEDGKVSLSMKKAVEPTARPAGQSLTVSFSSLSWLISQTL